MTVQDELDAARAEAKELQERFEAAERQARERDADAIVTGRKRPANTGRDIAELEAELEEARRRVEVLELAKERATTALVDTIEQHRERWLEESRAHEQETKQAYVQAAIRLSPNAHFPEFAIRPIECSGS